MGKRKPWPKELFKGEEYNYLTVISVDNFSMCKGERKLPVTEWKYLCKCKCGNTTSVSRKNLLNGHTKSCGCYMLEKVRKANSKSNFSTVENDYVRVFFNNDKGSFLISACDHIKIKPYSWCLTSLSSGEYVRARVDGKNIRLHRFLLEASEGEVVDHINHDVLDNRRGNLRLCTQKQNMMNTVTPVNNSSGVKGVSFCKTTSKWKAYITIDNKQKHLGRYQNKEDAVKARKKAEEDYFGEFSYDNSRGING